jgi:nucleoside-diphosphate-sugar epimerase
LGIFKQVEFNGWIAARKIAALPVKYPRRQQMKSAVVTGAAGFIGSHLCNELVSKGIEVTALVRNENEERLPKSVKCVKCDMDRYSSVGIDYADVFYHLAWEGATGAGRSDEKLQELNAVRSLDALELANRTGCKKFIGLGTVFEKLAGQIKNSMISNKSAPYILNKRLAHLKCLSACENMDMEFVWAEILHPIGKYIKTDQLAAYAIGSLLNNQVAAFGPAQEYFDITAAENIAYGLYLLGEKNVRQKEYYIGGGEPAKLADYLLSITRILGVPEFNLKIGSLPDDGFRYQLEWYDIGPLVRDTGYRPVVSFYDAVKNTAEYISSL